MISSSCFLASLFCLLKSAKLFSFADDIMPSENPHTPIIPLLQADPHFRKSSVFNYQEIVIDVTETAVEDDGDDDEDIVDDGEDDDGEDDDALEDEQGDLQVGLSLLAH